MLGLLRTNKQKQTTHYDVNIVIKEFSNKNKKLNYLVTYSFERSMSSTKKFQRMTWSESIPNRMRKYFISSGMSMLIDEKSLIDSTVKNKKKI